MSDDHETEHGLVMPFVAVQSRGGPYDDEAYCAGYEMGRLDAILDRDDEYPLHEPLAIQAANREQADLIAMRHGYVAEVALSDVEGWAHLRVRPAIDEASR